jgi:hypothetical protein
MEWKKYEIEILTPYNKEETERRMKDFLIGTYRTFRIEEVKWTMKKCHFCQKQISGWQRKKSHVFYQFDEGENRIRREVLCHKKCLDRHKDREGRTKEGESYYRLIKPDTICFKCKSPIGEKVGIAVFYDTQDKYSMGSSSGTHMYCQRCRIYVTPRRRDTIFTKVRNIGELFMEECPLCEGEVEIEKRYHEYTYYKCKKCEKKFEEGVLYGAGLER